MQDRYAGDVGDFVKIGLLRALSPGRKLGVAWYRFPDEGHNGDGRHVDYLKDPHGKASRLDPELLDHLRSVVEVKRSIRSLTPILGNVVSSDASLDVSAIPIRKRRNWRQEWFRDVLNTLSGCDLVFADPDNGLTDDDDRRKGRSAFGKQIPLAEVLRLTDGRTGVIYHHNTRRSGGHDAEIDYWISQIGRPTLAVRAKAYNCRTFFVINPDEIIADRVREFCAQWRSMKVYLHE
jgi:hypothetical protein